MLAFAANPVHTKLMQCTLKILILADDEGLVLTINGVNRYIDYQRVQTEQDLRNVLAGVPDYTIDAVIGMLKEMAQ